MLHPAQATWSSSGTGYARVSASPESQQQRADAAANEALTVSSLQSTPLYEQQAPTERVAMTLQPSFTPSQKVQPASPYNMDTAMFALGLVGLWMVVIGSAMLARRINQIKALRDTL